MFEFLFKYSRSDYGRGELVLTGDWPLWLSGAVALLGLILVVLMLLRRRGRASAGQLLATGTLQGLLLLIVIGMLQQPALQTEMLLPGENAIALVIDGSASMQQGAGESRFDAARRQLDALLAKFESLDLQVHRYAFADTARRVSDFAEATPAGSVTSVADSLLAVLEDARSSSLAAVVLASDAADTSGGVSVEQLGRLAAYGVPVHTIAVGREMMPEDLELAQVLMPATALPDSVISARLSIRHDRPGNTRVKVYAGDELLASEAVELLPDAATTTARVDIRHREAGHRELRFIVDGMNDESELRNNRRTRLVEVADQDFRVLYYEGEPRWEYKFLRRAVHADDRINLVSLLRVSTNKFYRQGLDSPEQLAEGFPRTREELFAYDALIIGSVEAASFTRNQLEIIRDFVSKRGGSLLLLAGPNGLGNGGWGQSAIADLLPAALPTSTTPSFVRRRAKPSLTSQGETLQMLRLADAADDNRRLWDELPEVADYQLTGSLKPAAITLLEVQTDRGRLPLLLTQPFGRGRTYILATGGTWRWQMRLPVEDQRHETFWQQFLRAIVASVPGRNSLSARISNGGSKIVLRAEFRDAAFDPVDDLSVSANVAHATDDSWTLDLLPGSAEPGVYTAEATPTASGAWFFEALANRDGEPFAAARASAFAESDDAEYFNIRANPALLRRVSEATGGRYLDAANLDTLTDSLRYSKAGITEAVHRPVWDAPAVFFLLLLLKTGEWLLRRRWSSI